MDAMSEALFKPDSDYLHLTGLKMEDAMVSLQGDVMLVASNPRNTPVRLEEGQLLGQMQPVEWVQQQEDKVTSTPAAGEGSEPKSTGTVCGLQQYDPDKCLEQLFGTLDLDGLYLNTEARQKLEGVLREFADTFALSDHELGTTHEITHTINKGSHPPIRQPPRRIPFSLRSKVNKMVSSMVNRGIVKPSKSPWANPIVFVAKKDGSIRFCVDYHRLNAATKMDVYPLPRIDDSLDLLAIQGRGCSRFPCTDECQVIAIFPWVGVILSEVYSQFLQYCKPTFPAH